MAVSLDPAAVSAPPGPAWCRQWTQQVDAAVAGWLAGLDGPGGVAVVGLGSYARRELCPTSDLDLLLLHDGWARADLEALVRQLCYPLWDAGLRVGYAVRTPAQAVDAAGARLDDATALTDHRHIAGSRGLLDALTARYGRWLRRHGAGVLTELARADARRHAASGPHHGMLEPDLKAGAGGLRDLHSLRWAAACLLGEVGLDPLVGAGYLGADDRWELANAGTVVLRARCALHLVREQGRGRAASPDRLRLDLQDDVAIRLALPDGPAGAGDRLLREVGLSTRSIAHIHSRTWHRLLADARRGGRRRLPIPEPVEDGVAMAGGVVELTAQASLRADPSLGWRAVAVAARCGTHLGRTTTARLRRELGAAPALPWDDAGRGALVATLRQGAGGLAALSDADHTGLLEAGLPGWERVRGTPQRNPLHTYDVDTHGAQAVAELVAISEGALDPRHAAIWEGLDEPEVVLLATFLHDVGKAWPGDHSEVGARVARDWLVHMGFDQRRADRVADLVRLHLLLPRVATRRDLDDRVELAAVAAAVADVATLDGLYLLSLADGRATGPAAHSAWKDWLLAELHARVRRLLVPEALRPGSSSPDDVVAQARTLAADAAEDALVDALLAGVPRRYLLAASPEQVLAHARLAAPVPGQGELHASLRAGPAAGTLTVTIVASDHLGLLADCAGVLAGHGLAVLDARAFTRSDGLALDWFVADATGWDDTDDRQVLADLAAAAAGSLDAAALVARREGRRDARPPAMATPVPVEVTFDRGPALTRVEVHAPDRPGLLYRLGRVLADAGLDVVRARVATLGPQVRDVFYVRPVSGSIDTTALDSRLHAATHDSERVSSGP